MKKLSLIIVLALVVFSIQACSNKVDEQKKKLETLEKDVKIMERDNDKLDSIVKSERELIEAKKKELGIE